MWGYSDLMTTLGARQVGRVCWWRWYRCRQCTKFDLLQCVVIGGLHQQMMWSSVVCTWRCTLYWWYSKLGYIYTCITSTVALNGVTTAVLFARVQVIMHKWCSAFW